MDEKQLNESYQKVLNHLISKYCYQIIELYSKEECVNDLAPILTNLGISDDILDRYRP